MSKASVVTIPVRGLDDTYHPVNTGEGFRSFPAKLLLDKPLAGEFQPPFFITFKELYELEWGDTSNVSWGDDFIHLTRGREDTKTKGDRKCVITRPDHWDEGHFVFELEDNGELNKADQRFIAQRISYEACEMLHRGNIFFDVLRATNGSRSILSQKSAVEVLLGRSDIPVEVREDFLTRHLVARHLVKTKSHMKPLAKHVALAAWGNDKLDIEDSGIDLGNVVARLIRMEDQIKPNQIAGLIDTGVFANETQIREAVVDGVNLVVDGKAPKTPMFVTNGPRRKPKELIAQLGRALKDVGVGPKDPALEESPMYGYKLRTIGEPDPLVIAALSTSGVIKPNVRLSSW